MSVIAISMRNTRLFCFCGLLGAILYASPAFGQGPPLLREAFTREYSLNVGGEQTPLVKEVVSRELSLFVGDEPTAPFRQTVTREYSILVTTPAVPDRVTQLTAVVSPTGEQAALDWTGYPEIAQNDVIRYRVYVSTSPLTNVAGLTPYMFVPAGTTTLTISNLAAWQDRHFAVVAEDALGGFDPIVTYSSAYVLAPQAISREVSLFVGGEPASPYAEAVSREISLLVTTRDFPERVRQLNVTASPTGDQAMLSWCGYNELPQHDVVRYRVYSATSPFTSVSNLNPVALVPAGTCSLTLSNLVVWQDRYFAVVAEDALGGFDPVVNYSAAYVLAPEAISREVSLFVGSEPATPYAQAVSREYSILVPDSAVPDPVTGINSGFEATTSTNAFSAIDFNWSAYNELAQRDVVRYRLYTGNTFFTDVTGMTPAAFVPAGSSRHTLGGLLGGNIYYVAAVAEDALGNFNPTVRSVSAKASIGALGEPRNLAVISGSNSLRFSWSAPEEVDAFLAYYRVYFDGNTNPVIVAPGTTQFEATNLQSATAYSIRVATVDTFSTESAGVSLVAATWLSNPTNVAGDSLDEVVRLSWSHVEPNGLVKHYAVYQSEANLTNVAGMSPVLTTRDTVVDVGGLVNGTQYYFAVTTVNISDGEQLSVQAVTTTPNPVVGAFGDLTVTNLLAPAEVFRGETISVQWAVTNVGAGLTTTKSGTPVAAWTDRVLLSANSVLGDADDVVLATVPHTGTLNSGGGYIGQASAQLPTNLFGNFTLFVRVDAAEEVYEYFDAATNLAVARQVLHIGPPAPPLITQQPVSQSVGVGDPVAFSVAATSVFPLTYQWQFKGTDRAGATDASLKLPNVTFGDAGAYRVIVSNAGGAATSSVAALTVTNPFCAPAPNGLVAWWKGEGTPADIAGTNHGVLMNGVTFTPGRVGTSFTFDGNDDFITAGPAIGNFGTNDFSFEVWIKVDPGLLVNNTEYGILNKNTFYAGVPGWGAELSTWGTYPLFTAKWFLSGQANWCDICVGAGTAIAAGSWHHFAGVRTGNISRLYLDGVLVGSTTNGVGSLNVDNMAPFIIGKNGWGASFPGQIDEPALYDRALSSEEIGIIYAAGSAGKCLAVNPPLALVVKARIDGRSRLVLREHEIFWDHYDYARPGLYYGNEPTLLNGYPWSPVWPDNQNSSAALSQPFLQLPLWLHSPIQLTNIVARESLSLVQQPDPTNDFTAIIEFNDNATGSAAYYEVTILMQSPFTPPEIAVEPQDRSAYWGDDVSLTVVAQGSPPLRYSWRQSGVPITDATNATLTLSNTQPGQAGNYDVVVANSSGSVTSQVAVLTIITNIPDLQPLLFASPSSAQAGELLAVSWTTTNSGNAAVTGVWQDRLVLAIDPSGSNVVAAFPPEVATNLAIGGALARARSVILPSGLSGNYWLFLRLDSANQVAEGYWETNNLAALPLTLVSPDLRVKSIGAQPGSPTFGQPFVISWVVGNLGSGPTPGGWTDRLWLSSTSNSVAGATLLSAATAVSPLLQSGSYSNTATATVPLTAQSQPGAYWLVVQTDATGAVSESDETNNLLSIPITVALPPLPDLVAGQLAAPASAAPGQTVTLAYAVTNAGAAPLTNAIWKETVYLVSEVGLDLTNLQTALASASAIQTVSTTNTLASGASLVRTQTVNLPAYSPLGNSRFLVRVDTDNAIVESGETNNLAAATNTTVIPALLTLLLPANQLLEGTTLTGTIWRNGSTAQPLTVTVTNSDPTELSLSLAQTTSVTTVVIPAGAASADFLMRALDDGVVDGQQSVALSASAPGFPATLQTLTVLDIQVPSLSLTLETNWVQEGLSIGASVVRDFVTTNAVTVYLQSNSRRLSVPASVTIPAGAGAQSFVMSAPEDNAAQLPAGVSINASASGFAGASASLTVLDNDTPSIMLTLAQTNVTESAGPQATLATLTRFPAGNGDVVIGLESSDPARVLVPSAMTIPAGLSSVTFFVSVLDNSAADGPHQALITPSILTAVGGTVVAIVPGAMLNVLDDDGPTLKVAVAKKLVPEGQNPATTALVSRNTPATNNLAVSLSSSDLAEATVPPSVTIPVGQASAQFNMVSLNDGATDGNKTVTISASASGYTSGSDTLTVSDVNLPDLVVTEASGPAGADTETYFNVSYRVANQGVTPAGTNFLTRIFLSSDPVVGNDTLVGQYTFNGTILPSQSFAQTLQVMAPSTAGKYWIVVTADVGSTVAEVLEDNNTLVSVSPVVVRPAYGASVQAGFHSAVAGTPVPMSGHATNSLGAPAAFKLVNLFIGLRGTTRIISALTDANGNFATTWQPLQNEAGHYTLGADYPGAATAAVQDEFTLYGFKANPAAAFLTVADQSSVVGVISLENQSEVPLTAMSASVISKPANLTVAVNVSTNVMDGDATNTLSYAIAADDASTRGGMVIVRVTSAAGATVDIPIAVEVQALQAVMVSNPNSLYAGMARGKQSIVEFDLVNQGGADSGPIVVSLPQASWLALVSTNTLPSLAPGASNHVTLQLTPATNLALGPYTGSLALNASNASLSVPFNFQCLSDSKGALKVSVVDEFTFYAEGNPKVAVAQVTLRDELTQGIVATGSTDTNGNCLFPEMTEGYYTLDVSAEKHSSFRTPFLVAAGVTNEVQAFLSRQTVTYSWTVTPIEVEDRYDIQVETTFETDVPVPVITVEPRVIDFSKLSQSQTQIELKISNHGLTAAESARIALPQTASWEITPLIEDVGTIPAKSEIRVPVTIRKRNSSRSSLSKSAAKKTNEDPCHAPGYVCWELRCERLAVHHCEQVDLVNMHPECINDKPSPPPQECLLCNERLIDPITRLLDGIIIPPPAPFRVTIKPCKDDCLILSALGCVPFPPISCAAAYGSCYQSVQDPDALTGLDCALMPLCAFQELPTPVAVANCLYGFARCFIKVESATKSSLGKAGKTGASSSLSGDPALAPYEAAVQAKFDLFSEFAGSSAPNWLNALPSDEFSEWWAVARLCTTAASDNQRIVNSTEQSQMTTGPLPLPLDPGDVVTLVTRWNNTISNWQAGTFEPTNSDNFVSRTRVLALSTIISNGVYLANLNGFSDPVEAIFRSIQAKYSASPPQGVCARLKLRLEQSAVLARDAFRANLEMENNDASTIEGIGITLTVRTEGGADATGLFGINLRETSGFSSIEGAGMLAPSAKGSAAWIIVPAAEAASHSPQNYRVGGTLTFTSGGEQVTLPLEEVLIQVLPQPRLSLQYFHERSVFSDDPFTGITEPSIPFNLAVMVQNKGYGVAKNFRITSAQPQIVDNQKGLLIDFKLIGTEVAGQNLSPSLTANFGDINPGQISIGRWLMTSTLQGLFTDYKATFQHTDELGGLRTSLIEDVSIHEMIHLVRAPGIFEDGKPDFLVNEIPDAPYDLPDRLYLSDGTTNPVTVVMNGSVIGALSGSSLVVTQTAVMPPGWAYLRVSDPGYGQFSLVRVVRSDGVEIYMNTNVWTTDRTFIGMGLPPIRENILHLFDYNSTGSYALFYTIPPAPDTQPPSSAVAALPGESYPRFSVDWNGGDNSGDNGLAYFDIYVSDNGAPFTRWLERTGMRSAIYPGVLGHAYAFYSRATDASGNVEPAPSIPQASTTVSKTNSPPVFTNLAPQTIDEGQTLSFKLEASDPDNDPVDFMLLGSPPVGLSLDPGTGNLVWPTTEVSGPSTNTLTVVATDRGFPPLGVTGTVQMVVREVNSAPTLDPLPNRTFAEGATLLLSLAARDYDIPANRLTFGLAASAPAGVTVNPTNALLRWTPSSLQGPSTNRITVFVYDDGGPSLGATQQFTVIVRDTLPDVALGLGHTNLFVGESNSVPLMLSSSLELTNLSFQLSANDSRLTNLTWLAGSPEVTSATLAPLGSSLFRAEFELNPALQDSPTRRLASLGFLALSNAHSAILPLGIQSLHAVAAAGPSAPTTSTSSGRLIVVGAEPVLDIDPAQALTLYGHPGRSYGLQYRTNLFGSDWYDFTSLTLSGRTARLAQVPRFTNQTFYRAWQMNPFTLMLGKTASSAFDLTLQGQPGVAYRVQTSTNLANWSDFLSLTLTNTSESVIWTNPLEDRRFFRAILP